MGLGSGGGSVLTGSWEVGVGVRFKTGVAVFLGCPVAVLSAGGWVDVAGSSPVQGKVGVGVGLRVTNAMPPGRPVSGGEFIPSKSWMISNPMAGTETGISSTP